MKGTKGFAVLSSMALATTVFLSACGGGASSTSTKPADNKSGATQGADKAAAPAADKNYTIKVANYFATDHPQNVALREKFKKLVEEGSKGTLKVEIYDNSKLGAEKEFYDGVRNGTIEMGIPGMIMQADVAKMAVPEWPFLFKDYAHVQKVLNGPIGDDITSDLEKTQGVIPLAWSANGFRMFSSSKPIKSLADFKGLRLRMPNIPNYIKLGQLLGANVTPMAISEVFNALQEKVVDGQDNPIATLRASSWYEAQSDVLESNHMFSPNIYIINKKFFDKLSPNQQKVVKDAAKASAAYEFELMAKSYEDDKKFLESKGVKFTTPDDKFMQDMSNAAKPLYDDIFKKYPWAKDMYDKIKAEAK